MKKKLYLIQFKVGASNPKGEEEDNDGDENDEFNHNLNPE
jgi:hypothetical protein